jgi:hypothetical protein
MKVVWKHSPSSIRAQALRNSTVYMKGQSLRLHPPWIHLMVHQSCLNTSLDLIANALMGATTEHPCASWRLG